MNIGMIELIGVFGLVIAVLGWQYWSVSRDIAKDKEKKSEEEEESSS